LVAAFIKYIDLGSMDMPRERVTKIADRRIAAPGTRKDLIRVFSSLIDGIHRHRAAG
jgi:hypothetical protein